MTTFDEAVQNVRRGWRMPWGKLLGSLIVLAILAIVGLIIFRILFVNFVDNYQIGYAFDSRNGKITVFKESGYYVTAPFVVSVHHVDMRPMQVCINANQRVLNCKLVQFEPAGLELFLSWHGRNNYDGPGTGVTAETSTFSEILKSYAYDGSGRRYTFLKIIRELKPEDTR